MNDVAFVNAVGDRIKAALGPEGITTSIRQGVPEDARFRASEFHELKAWRSVGHDYAEFRRVMFIEEIPDLRDRNRIAAEVAERFCQEARRALGGIG